MDPSPSRRFLYLRVADEIRARVDANDFDGGLLPGEIELAGQFGASRLTIRKALAHLREEGVVDSRRGAGWYATRGRLRHSLNHLASIEGQLADLGVASERRILDFAFVPAEDRVRAVLGTDAVLRFRRMNLADGEPIALVTVWCPEEFGRHMSKAAVGSVSLYDLLPVKIAAATQVISAVEICPEDAALLGVAPGAAGLMSERITTDTEGRTVLYAIAIFPGQRTEYVAQLSPLHASGPGLRLSTLND